MSDKVNLSVFYSGRTIPIVKTNGTIVQQVLESACSTLKIDDPSSVRLVLEKGEKAVDHSSTIKIANIKTNTKLAIVKAPANRSAIVSLTLQHKEASYTASLPASSTLYDVLTHVEKQSGGQKWTDWHGIPEPEVNKGFELHINVAGYMQPILEVLGKKFEKDADLKSTTLTNLGLAADSAQPKKVKMKLTHAYTPPVRTVEEQAQIMANFQKKYAEMTGGGNAAASSSSAAAPPSQPSQPPHIPALEEEEDEDVEMSDSSSEDDQAPFTLPSDRHLKLFHALPGLMKQPELPEEFYEVTEEDSKVYARGLRREAAKYARERNEHAASGGATIEVIEDQPTRALNPAFNSSPPPAAASSSSSSRLLDSTRLPPVPSGQERRNARVRRKCKAALLRIRLPNHLYIEAMFKLQETPKEVYTFLDTILEPTYIREQDYYLYITPPRQVLSRSSKLTLEQLGLYPQALVHVGSAQARDLVQGVGAFHVPEESEEERKAKEQPAAGIIRQEFWNGIQTETTPPTSQTTTPESKQAQLEESKEKEKHDVEMTPAQ